MNKSNYLPTCQEYKDYLTKAVKVFKITIDEARSKYGLYSQYQWEELFKNQSN
jgi:hypothetical protein